MLINKSLSSKMMNSNRKSKIFKKLNTTNSDFGRKIELNKIPVSGKINEN